jgi:D-glucosaminate-6-phosphate ammonia-lyase
VNIYESLGVVPVINAKGPATRLSGGIMRPAVAAAMVEASRHCVDMADLQAAASRRIAAATGAEAGYVASGASACLLLATAACMTGLDPGRMARLPETSGMKNEVVMVRSQRNFYDHAIRSAGAHIIEVGLPDRYAGSGVRDAEVWEIEDAITEATAAIFYVADENARPPLAAVIAAAHAKGVPVIVDAAAQLPPQSNLRHFIGLGADLVAFSGGKALGGPQASGILCGRRDLVMAAALQHLDMDVFWDLWEPPATLIDKARLRGAPQHGIGRPCKAGKEEIAGLLAALELFIAEGDAARHARWLATCEAIRNGLPQAPGLDVRLLNAGDATAVPLLELAFDPARHDAANLALRLQRGAPPVFVDAHHRDRHILVVNPMCVAPDEVELLTRRLAEVGA